MPLTNSLTSAVAQQTYGFMNYKENVFHAGLSSVDKSILDFSGTTVCRVIVENKSLLG